MLDLLFKTDQTNCWACNTTKPNNDSFRTLLISNSVDIPYACNKTLLRQKLLKTLTSFGSVEIMQRFFLCTHEIEKCMCVAILMRTRYT